MARPKKVVFNVDQFAGTSTWDGNSNTSVLLTSEFPNLSIWTPVNNVSDPSGGYQGTDLAITPLANEFGFRRALTQEQVTIPVPPQGTMNSTAYAQLQTNIANANTEIQSMRVQYYGEGTRLPGGTGWITASGTDPSTASGWKTIAVRTDSNVAAIQDDEGVWIPKTLPISEPWTAAAVANGHIMIIAGRADSASRVAVMSSDGDDWQVVYIGGTSRAWRDIAPHQDKFIIIPGTTTDSESLTFANPPAGLLTGTGFSVPITAVGDFGDIVTLGTIVPGSGYTNGTYTNVVLKGSRTFIQNAQATITVTGGQVTGCVLSSVGSYYLGPNTSARNWIWDQDAYTSNEDLVFYPTGLAAGLAAGSGFSVDLIETGVGTGTWLGAIVPGSGYTNGTYNNVRLQGTVSNANNMEATIVVSGGQVTEAYVTADGSGYISPAQSGRTSGSLPIAADWRSIASNGEYMLATRSGTNNAARSTNGVTWSGTTLPTGTDWIATGTGWRTSTHNFTITPSNTRTYTDMPIFKIYSARNLTNRTATTVTGIGSGATFNVVIESGCYTSVTINNGGTQFEPGDTLVIDGGYLDGTTVPAGIGGDISITVTAATEVSGVITGFTWSGNPKNTFYPLDITGGYLGTVDITVTDSSYTSVTVNNPGEEYAVGQQYIVPGWALNGAANTNTNSITLTVTGVDTAVYPGITTINPVLTNPAIARTDITGSFTRTHDFDTGIATITGLNLTQTSPAISLDETFTILGTSINATISNNLVFRASVVDSVQVTSYKNTNMGTLQTLVYDSGIIPRAVFIATRASASNQVARSTDSGATWATKTLPSSQIWTAVSLARGRMVVAAPDTTLAATSVDGSTWSSNTLVESQTWSHVIFDGTRFVLSSSSRYPLVKQFGVDADWRRYQDEYLSDWTQTTMNVLAKTSGTELIGVGTGTLRRLSSLLTTSTSTNLDTLIIDETTTSEDAAKYLAAAWLNRNLLWILSDSTGGVDTARIFPIESSDPDENPVLTSIAWTGTQILGTNGIKLYSLPASISSSNYVMTVEGDSTTFGGAITGLNVADGILYVATSDKTWTATL